MADARSASRPTFKDIRLVLDSTPSDAELKAKVQAVAEELKAIDEALDDEGTYLGIVDKEKLRTRRCMLVQRSNLLKEERRLLQSLRTSMKEMEKERPSAEKKMPGVAPPRQGGRTVEQDSGRKADAKASTTLVRTPMSNPTPVGGTTLNLSPPLAASAGIGEFLKANASVGRSSLPNPKRARYDRGMVDADNDVIMS